MKIESLRTVYDLMHYCHMPVWCQREVRDMKVGDTYLLGRYRENFFSEDLNEEVEFVGDCWIEKERGSYSFNATWTIPAKPSRAFVMISGKFKILKGGIVEFGNDLIAFRSFALVSRYLNRLVMKMTAEEKQVYFSAGAKPLLRGVCIDKDSICKRPRYIKDGDSVKRTWLDYSNYLPNHPLEAIVTAGIALKQI